MHAKMDRTIIFTDPPLIKDPKLKNFMPYSPTVTVEWDVEMKVDGFSVLLYIDGQNPKESITKVSILNLKVQPDSIYNVQVACIQHDVTGRYSNVLQFKTDPKGPYGLEVTPGIYSPSTSLTVKYQDDDKDGKEYHILLKSSSEKKKMITTELTETIDGLSPGTFYDVHVRGSKNGVKRKPCILEKIATFPGKVRNLRCEQGRYASSQSISWDSYAGASSYLIKYRRLDKNCETRETVDTEITLDNLDSGHQFSVRVAAKNSSGIGIFTEPLVFVTEMALSLKITVTPGKDDPSTAVLIKIDDQKMQDSEYRILVKPISDGLRIRDIDKVIDGNQCIIQNLKPGTQYTASVWLFAPNSGDRNSKTICSEEFWTAPKLVSGIEYTKDSHTSVHVKWDPSPGTVSYIVNIRRDGEEPESKATNRSWIYLKDLQPHSKYELTIQARNGGGESKESQPITFKTAPHNPKAIQVRTCMRSPTKAITVYVTEHDVPVQQYELKVISLGSSDNPVVNEMFINRREARMGKIIEGLEPGENYQVSVCSFHMKKRSEEIFSEVIQTCLPPLVVEFKKISKYNYKFTWNPLNDAIEYKFKWRIEDDESWQTKTVRETEKVLRDLTPGCTFEVKVTAYSNVGQGDSSQLIRFTTVPGTVTHIQYEITFTREVRITCKKVEGATRYLFDILGEQYLNNEPHLILVHDDEATEMTATVSARNISGFGPPSKTLEFRQTLLHVQKKFIQLAKNKFKKEQFIPLIFRDVSTNDIYYDFGTENFHIGNGETILISGGHFTGKTACCSYYLQTLKEDELGIFLDMEEFQEKSDLTIEAILKSAVSDISKEEMAFLVGWMKKHSNKVVIVIDNFSLPTDHTADNKSLGSTKTHQHLFYSLAKVNRVIFPYSRVLCATNQDHVQQIICPTLSLKIKGFGNNEVKEMKLAIFAEYPWLPKHWEYFCTNPSYCKIILQFLRNPDKKTDMESYASVALKVLMESIERYSEKGQKKKLMEILKEIYRVPRKLQRVEYTASKKPADPTSTFHYTKAHMGSFGNASETSAQTEHSCKILQDSIATSLFFALICDLKEFTSWFQKKRIVLGDDAEIFIMASGFLRQETSNMAIALFKKVDSDFNKKIHALSGKRKFLKRHIRDNISSITEQLTTNSQVLLDWCDICTEIQKNEMWTKHPIQTAKVNFSDSEAAEQIIYFFTRVRHHAYATIKHNLTDDVKDHISDAVKQNHNIAKTKVNSFWFSMHSPVHHSENFIQYGIYQIRREIILCAWRITDSNPYLVSQLNNEDNYSILLHENEICTETKKGLQTSISIGKTGQLQAGVTSNSRLDFSTPGACHAICINIPQDYDDENFLSVNYAIGTEHGELSLQA